MGEPTVEKILILTSHQATAQRLAAMLQGPEWIIWADRSNMPESQQPTVVVTDGTAADIARMIAREVGIIRLTPSEAVAVGPAEVRLPENATARELRLACQLLGQIARLHRQHRDGADLRRRLFQETLTDPLTGLPNRRAWDSTLAERLATLRPRERLCLAILDLDYFKQVNDTYGHPAGDQVLQHCGRALSNGLRQDDFAARLGGDEFGLLLWVPDEQTAATVVERVRAQVPLAACQRAQCASKQADAGPHRSLLSAACTVTASAGYCLTPEQSSAAPLPCPAELLAAADAALREAKHRGRDRTVDWKRDEG